MGSPKGFSRADIDKSLGELSETCRRMDEAIAKKGPWLMGEQFTLADVLVMPSIDRMADLGLVDDLGRANIRASANGMSTCKRDPLSKRPIIPGSRVSEFLELQPLYAADRG